MNVYNFLKLLDKLLGIESYSYLYATLLFGIFSTTFILTLYRLSIKTEAKDNVYLPKGDSSQTASLIAILLALVLFIVPISSIKMELQYIFATCALATILTMSRLRLNRFSNLFIALLLVPLVDIMLMLNLGIEVGEQTPDTAMIMLNGYWRESLKDPYYDLINVYSVIKAILNIIMGINAAESLVTSLMLSAINSILVISTAYLIIRGQEADYRLLLPASLVLASNPGVTFNIGPPALSMTFSLLAAFVILMLFRKGKLDRSENIACLLLFSASILTHGTGIVVLTLLALLLVIAGSTSIIKRYRTLLLTALTLYFVILLARTALTGALRGAFLTYLSEIIAWFTGFQLMRRSVKWSAEEVPRVTAYSWVLLISLAITPLISNLLDKLVSKQKNILPRNYSYTLLALTGVLFVGLGFIATFFSNSLGRELYYPGLMLLGMATPYSLKDLTKKGKVWMITYLLILASITVGLITPTKMPLYEPYRELTIAWRGSDYTHYLYAMSVSHFIEDVTPPMYVKSDDEIPLSYSLLVIHGRPFKAFLIKSLPENIPLNVVWMFDADNYIALS
ncbi:MAG: hypothetical protein QW566_05355 [Candidatus Jordarchaeales archaeon]